MNFEHLGLIKPILSALKEKGYKNPTPIQSQAIPVILDQRDVLGCAQTGTGKTAAFAIPIIQLIANKKRESHPVLRSLIVTPTRELAIQIDENIKAYSKNTHLRHTVVFGGVKQGQQVEKLRGGVDILTATPGRLLDLIGQGYISLDKIELFVLDEADRMLDMGFINDIKKLLKLLPTKRQSLFFSATMPDAIVKLSNTILDRPVKIEVTPASTTADTIQQFIYYTNRNLKNDLLIHILDEKSISQALVFSRTKHGADRIARRLKKAGIHASAIHGDKAQNQRQKALSLFKEGKVRVLVATDIAARGIDIDKLKYVINFDIPNQPETYVHRIGRSGRAGEEGVSISICEPEENAYVKDIQKLIGKKIEIVEDHPFPQTDKPMTAAEKKEWNKEKQRRKQEFFKQRKASKNRPQKSRENSKEPQSTTDTKNNSKNKKNKPTNSQSRNNQNANPKKKNNRGKRKRTDSPKLKNKYMWPLEK